MYTKRAIIEDAYAELALAGWVWDLQPEEIQWAVKRLDMMASRWAFKGIMIGYPGSSDPAGSNPDEELPVQDYAIEPLVMNLAVTIAAGKGKQLQGRTLASAIQGYNDLIAEAASNRMIPLRRPYYMPIGAGNKPQRYFQGPFVPPNSDDPLPVAENGDLILNGGNQ